MYGRNPVTGKFRFGRIEAILLVKIFGYPLVGLIYLGSLGRFFWLDLLYGMAIAIGLPKLIISFFV